MARPTSSQNGVDITGSGGFSYMVRGARNPPKEPEGSFEGMTVLVTGASSGLVSYAHYSLFE